MKCYLPLILATVVLLSPAKAASPLEPTGSLQEQYFARVKLGGRVLVGLRRGEAVGPLSVSNLAIMVPSSDLSLCFEMTTRDGRYEGFRFYRVVEGYPRLAPLGLTSNHEASLRQYRASDIALLAELKSQCGDTRAGAIVPVGFMGAMKTGTISVYLNARASIVRVELIKDNEDTGLSADCPELEDGVRTAYNRVCTLSVSETQWNEIHRLNVSISGYSGRERQEEYQVNLGPF
jgi:hypothetical protein